MCVETRGKPSDFNDLSPVSALQLKLIFAVYSHSMLSMPQVPVAVDRANATFAVRSVLLEQEVVTCDQGVTRLSLIGCVQVRKPNWALPRVEVKREESLMRNCNDLGEEDVGRLPVVEGRGGSVKRVKAVGDKEVVRFR